MELKKISDNGVDLIESDGKLSFRTYRGQFFTYDGNSVEPILQNRYLKSIAGENWQKRIKQPYRDFYDYSWTRDESGNLYTHNFHSGILRGIDPDGDLFYEAELDEIVPCGHATYDIEFQEPNFMWLAFPSGQTITQIDLTTKAETFRIGEYTFEDIYEPLSYPESLHKHGNNLFIPSMGTGKIHRLNLIDMKLSLHTEIKGNPWEYLRINSNEYVRLGNDEGIFELINNATPTTAKI